MAAQLSERPAIDPTAHVRLSTLGRYTEIGARTSFAESTLGDYSYIVNDGEIIHTTIGKFCSIAAHVRLNPGNHPMWRASQSHFTYRSSAYFGPGDAGPDDRGETDDADFFAWRRAHPLTIGHDVWIGHGVVVMPGVTIGNGAVIGAGAIVTKDVARYQIVAGVAAKPIKDRFPPAIADALEALAWWDWEHERLRHALEDFRTLSVEAFIAKHATRTGPGFGTVCRAQPAPER